MSKIKMDLKTAKWIADKAQNDIAAFPVELVECEKCGAVFMPNLGHDCNNVIELELNDVTETAEADIRNEAKEIGDRIKERLNSKGTSQRELANICGVTEVSMSRYIRGDRTPKGPLLGKIAKALGCSVEWLLGM